MERFIYAQEATYAEALSELQAGDKQSHWMWYIFPQIAGLGYSAMSRKYALAGLDEARSYLAHDVLGPRLRECIEAVLEHEDKTAHQIFGSPDDLKFCSCLTLFAHAAPDEPLFQHALSVFYDGEEDQRTVELL